MHRVPPRAPRRAGDHDSDRDADREQHHRGARDAALPAPADLLAAAGVEHFSTTLDKPAALADEQTLRALAKVEERHDTEQFDVEPEQPVRRLATREVAPAIEAAFCLAGVGVRLISSHAAV